MSPNESTFLCASVSLCIRLSVYSCFCVYLYPCPRVLYSRAHEFPYTRVSLSMCPCVSVFSCSYFPVSLYLRISVSSWLFGNAFVRSSTPGSANFRPSLCVCPCLCFLVPLCFRVHFSLYARVSVYPCLRVLSPRVHVSTSHIYMCICVSVFPGSRFLVSMYLRISVALW